MRIYKYIYIHIYIYICKFVCMYIMNHIYIYLFVYTHIINADNAYHSNNHTRVRTQGLSQSTSTLWPLLACMLNQSGKSVTVADQELSTVWVSNSRKFLAEIMILGNKKSKNFRKKSHTLRVTKRGGRGPGNRWLLGWSYGPLFGMRGTKISVPLARYWGIVTVPGFPSVFLSFFKSLFCVKRTQIIT